MANTNVNMQTTHPDPFEWLKFQNFEVDETPEDGTKQKCGTSEVSVNGSIGRWLKIHIIKLITAAQQQRKEKKCSETSFSWHFALKFNCKHETQHTKGMCTSCNDHQAIFVMHRSEVEFATHRALIIFAFAVFFRWHKISGIGKYKSRENAANRKKCGSCTWYFFDLFRLFTRHDGRKIENSSSSSHRQTTAAAEMWSKCLMKLVILFDDFDWGLKRFTVKKISDEIEMENK